MIDVLLVVLAILLCLISLMKAKEYRQTGLSTHGWMAFVFAFLALAFLLRISGVYLWVERAFGPKSLADAVVRTALMAAAFGAQSLIREVSTQNPMPEPLGGGGFRRGEGSRGRSLGDCLR